VDRDGRRKKALHLGEQKVVQALKRPPENTYEAARQLAWKVLSERSPGEIAANGLLNIDSASGRIEAPFLADRYHVDIGARKVFFESGAEVYPFLSVLLLHYLVGVSEESPTGEWISFREFEGGDAYIGSFADRSLRPLRQTFGNRPDLLRPAAEPLGAQPLDLGDVSVQVPVFPKVPLAFVVWRGDDEFPPDANILFDSTANSILRTEDLAICGALTVSKLRKNADKL
jgi:hypothetical protein